MMDIFRRLKSELDNYSLNVESMDVDRPWGGFFVIKEVHVERFAEIYFDGLSIQDFKFSNKLSPKILIVKPFSRLSWQYHHRRAETWKIIEGPVGVKRSYDNVEGELLVYNKGDIISLKQEERHRLIGLNNWAVVAEFWQHTDSFSPSDETDIVRLQDDYGR
jgi:mannose-6-phosphate isomerase-like protein (cupin superfamily)